MMCAYYTCAINIADTNSSEALPGRGGQEQAGDAARKRHHRPGHGVGDQPGAEVVRVGRVQQQHHFRHASHVPKRCAAH